MVVVAAAILDVPITPFNVPVLQLAMLSKSVRVAHTSVAVALISTDVSTVAWVGLSWAMLPLIKCASQDVSAAKGVLDCKQRGGKGG